MSSWLFILNGFASSSFLGSTTRFGEWPPRQCDSPVAVGFVHSGEGLVVCGVWCETMLTVRLICPLDAISIIQYYLNRSSQLQSPELESITKNEDLLQSFGHY